MGSHLTKQPKGNQNRRIDAPEYRHKPGPVDGPAGRRRAGHWEQTRRVGRPVHSPCSVRRRCSLSVFPPETSLCQSFVTFVGNRDFEGWEVEMWRRGGREMKQCKPWTFVMQSTAGVVSWGPLRLERPPDPCQQCLDYALQQCEPLICILEIELGSRNE